MLKHITDLITQVNPNIWKVATMARIIAILKPGKPPDQGGSYRHLTTGQAMRKAPATMPE